MEHAITDPNVARAIRRSRAARAARKSRMRKRIIAATCASLALGGGLSLSLSGLTAADAVYASVQKAKSLADLLGQRSPGERTEGQLTKTKRAGALARHRLPLVVKPLTPSATDLAKILLPPAAELPVDFAKPVPLVVPPPTLASIIVPPGGGSTPIVTPPGGTTPGGSPPGGSPPGGGNPPLISPPTSPELIPAVPEPGTWATMLLGFAFIGWRVRREKPTAQLILLRA